MIGANKIQLNQATLVQAVQEWVNKRVTVETPKVGRIETENMGGGAVVFNVIINSEVSSGKN